MLLFKVRSPLLLRGRGWVAGSPETPPSEGGDSFEFYQRRENCEKYIVLSFLDHDFWSPGTPPPEGHRTTMVPVPTLCPPQKNSIRWMIYFELGVSSIVRSPILWNILLNAHLRTHKTCKPNCFCTWALITTHVSRDDTFLNICPPPESCHWGGGRSGPGILCDRSCDNCDNFSSNNGRTFFWFLWVFSARVWVGRNRTMLNVAPLFGN